MTVSDHLYLVSGLFFSVCGAITYRCDIVVADVVVMVEIIVKIIVMGTALAYLKYLS